MPISGEAVRALEKHRDVIRMCWFWRSIDVDYSDVEKLIENLYEMREIFDRHTADYPRGDLPRCPCSAIESKSYKTRVV